MVTIFTPTYNRAYILPQLYRSLQMQLNRNFEWLIVDDGSSDNTHELITEWVKENKICIRYVQQDNGGKHRAINAGLKEANGDWFFIVDSDDLVTPDAVDWILKEGEQIKNLSDFAGLSGIRVYRDGKRIGGDGNFGTIDSNALEIRIRHNVKGDLAEIFKTEVLRKFLFPEYKGEKFCPEALVWNRLARTYKTRYIYHPIYICEYLNDGLTANIIKIRRDSPMASMTYYSELYHSNIPTKQRLKASINFWRFAKINNIQDFNMCSIISSLCLPIGLLLRLRDMKYIN